MTHTDPRAEAGAFAIAMAARVARHSLDVSAADYLGSLTARLKASHLTDRVALAVESVARGDHTMEFADSLGLGRGVTGFIDDTVPIVIHSWLRHPLDFRTAVSEVIMCGGDADSTAALVGGIIGTRTGPNGIPSDWVSGLAEWPRTIDWMKRLALGLERVLETGRPESPPNSPPLPLMIRNGAFFAVVLAHGFYRLRPW